MAAAFTSGMRITALVTLLASLLIVGTLERPALAQPKDAAAAQIVALLGASRPALSVAAPLTELGVAGDPPRGHAAVARPRQPFLDARDVTTLVTPHASDIERCYLGEIGALARSSRLDLTLVIARDGHVLALAAAVPGLPVRTARKVTGCVREVLDSLQFPARRNDTTAVVPYVFQKTDAPSAAGPQLSCWNPKGC
jgi:hypothetical protein